MRLRKEHPQTDERHARKAWSQGAAPRAKIAKGCLTWWARPGGAKTKAERGSRHVAPVMEWNGNIEDDKLHREVIGPGSGTDKLRQLLRTASPAAIDSCDPAGYTILMAAIKGGKSDRAVMLIDNGADITPVNASGWWRLGPSNTAGREPARV